MDHARSRIEHVVVLMLENRSFDHLLGFLDLGEGPLDPRRYPNPVNLGDPAGGVVYPTSDAAYALSLDPPHSHKGVMEQLSIGLSRRARMNGFVSAYARKAMGMEERPIVHWARIFGAGVIAVAVATALAAALWPWLRAEWWRAVALGILLVAGLGTAMWRWKRGVDSATNAKLSAPEIAAAQAQSRKVMDCMKPERIPVMAALATHFATCRAWFSSVPGETWPNRNFLHAATSDGTVEIEIGLYRGRTIFELLEDAGHSWRIYIDGMPHAMVFKNLWDRAGRWSNWYTFEGMAGDPGFTDHVAAGDLPTYAFIEPQHMGAQSNSQHPGNNEEAAPEGESDFERGEQLVATVYEALRANPEVFAKTLLVITYDEHGGFFDGASPPRAPAPSPLVPPPHWSRRLVAFFVERVNQHFDFKRLGVRVPALIVSPWIDPGPVDTIFDHTSVITTLRKLFAPDSAPLTERDAAANSFEHLVADRAQPRDDLPDLSEHLPGARPQASPMAAGGGRGRPHDSFLAQLDELADRVDGELGRRPEGAPQAVPLDGTRIAAGPHSAVVGRFLGGAVAARQK